MSDNTQIQEIVTRFEEANNELMAFVESCSDEDWAKVSEEEKWSVGVIAYHVAASHAGIAGLVKLIANEQPVPPLTAESFNESNQRNAEKAANCTKAEVLELARNNGAQAISIVSSLSDEQLDRSADIFGRSLTTQNALEYILIGHIKEHLVSMKAAIS